MSGPGAGVGPGPAGSDPTHSGLAAPGWHYEVDRPEDPTERGTSANPDTTPQTEGATAESGGTVYPIQEN